MPLDPYFSAGKLAWLLENDEAVAAAGDAGTLRLGTVDSFLCARLGARFETDPSTASRTQLGAPEWDPELLRLFGVPAETLPTIADTAGDLGTLSHPDWPVDLPLSARCVDQQAALAGAGCVTQGLAKATYGTGVFLLAHVGDSRPAPVGGLVPTVAWRIGDRVEWALDGGVFTAGALLEWLTGELGPGREPGRARGRGRRRGGGQGRTGPPRPCRYRSPVVEARRARRDLGTDCRRGPGARRAGGARRHRVACGGRAFRGSRNRVRRCSSRGRRPHAERPAASATGGRRGRSRPARGGRRYGRGGRGAGGRGSGRLRVGGGIGERIPAGEPVGADP